MPEGKFFNLRTDIQDGVALTGGPEAGSKAVTQTYTGEDDQCWYECVVTGTIRNKKTGLCLDVNASGDIVVNRYNENAPSQEWTIANDKVQNKHDHNRLIQWADGQEGCTVLTGDFENEHHNIWKIEYLETAYHYIVSKYNNKVITVKPADKAVLTVVMWDRVPGDDHQLWYEDKHGLFRCKANDFVFECKESKEGASMHVSVFSPGQPHQMWALFGDCIVSQVHPKHVVAIKKKSDTNGAKLVIGKFKNEANTGQHWSLEYV